MYIYTYIHTYVTYIHIREHLHIYMYIYINIHTHIYTYIHTYIQVHTYVHIYIHIYTYTHIHIHIYIHTLLCFMKPILGSLGFHCTIYALGNSAELTSSLILRSFPLHKSCSGTRSNKIIGGPQFNPARQKCRTDRNIRRGEH